MTKLHEYEVDQQVFVRGIKFSHADPKWWLYTVIEVTDTTVTARNPGGAEAEITFAEPDDYQSIRPVTMSEIAMPRDPGQDHPDGYTIEIRDVKGALHSRYVHQRDRGWIQVAGPDWETDPDQGHEYGWDMIVFLTMSRPGNWLAERRQPSPRLKMGQARA